MKYIHYSLMVFLGITMSLNAQQLETNPKLEDSLSSIIYDAFDLTDTGEYVEAIAIGADIYSKYCNVSNDNRLKARIYDLFGVSYSYIGDDSLGLDYMIKSKDIYLKLKDTADIISAYNNLGVNYRNLKDINTSNKYFEKILVLVEQIDMPEELAYTYSNLGINLISNENENDNDSYKSLEYFKKAEATALEYHKDQPILGDILCGLAEVYHKVGKPQKSLEYYNKGMAFAKKHNHIYNLSELQQLRSEIEAEEKDFEKAYHLLKAHTKLQDSIFTIEEFEKAKQIEADNFLKDNAEKLQLIEREKEIQQAVLTKTKTFNYILTALITILLLFAFWVYVKNRQLKDAKFEAEKLSKVKSDFYSEISHELRTPLYAVIELSGILLKENPNAAHKEYLESLKFSGNHLLALINNVLELNKVEFGKMKIESFDFNLKKLISNILESLEYALRDSNNTIKLDYDNSIPSLLSGDSLKLSQILINLVSNAIKFTSDGRIEVVIKMVEGLGEKVKIYFRVSDNGLGIPLENQKLIFEDFYQESAKHSKSYKGTGLGLSIVKRVLSAMSSELVLVSKEDEGATFFFELVFDRVNEQMSGASISENLSEPLRGFTILIVDDNKINQLVTGKVLEHLGVDYVTADSGFEAIEILKNKSFECVLMDLHMPELDGYETTMRIRQFNTDTPIIALTAAASEEAASKTKKYGLNGYILKPFATDDFIKIITEAVYPENKKIA